MVTLSGDKRIKVQIWDTGTHCINIAGQEQYRAITSAYLYHDISVIIAKLKEHWWFMISLKKLPSKMLKDGLKEYANMQLKT